MKEGWKRKKIKDISVLIADGDWIESKDQSDEGIRLIQTGNIGNGVFKAKEDKPHYISECTFYELGCTEIFSGDCLVSRLPEPVGRACLIPEIGCRMITAVDCSIIRFKEIILPKLFIYYTQSATYNRDVSNLTTGTTRKRISRKNLESILIPIPPLEEQERIVEELDCLSGVIEKKKQQLKELDALAQSIFYEMFGNPVENDRGWEVKKLGEVAEIVGGSTPKTNIDEYWNGDNYWVTPAELDGSRYIELTERCITELAIAKTNLTLLPIGTVLLSSRAPIGKVSITRVPMYCNQGFKNVVCSDLLHNEYVYQFLYEIKDYLNSLGTGATFKEISKSTTEKVAIPIPPFSLQQQFAEKIELIEKQKELIRKSIEDVEMLFNSRMDYYFR